MSNTFFQDVEAELKNILCNIPPIDAKKVAKIENAEPYTAPLYLVDEKHFKDILYLEQRVRAYYDNNGKKAPKDPFRYFAKIITIDKVYKYSIGSKHIYKDIIDRDKILRDMPATLNAYKQNEKQRVEKLLKDEEWSEESRIKLLAELEQNLAMCDREMREIEKNFENYDVLISNYEANHIYPIIYYTTIDGTNKHTMIRRDIPNILFYKEDKQRSQARGDKKMERIIKEYGKTCNIIYYKKKEES